MIPRLGNARLAIPRVNQNPRPPRLKVALGNRIAAPRAPRPVARAQAVPQGPKPAVGPAQALTTAQPSNTATSPGSTSAAAATQYGAPAPPPTPDTNPFALPSYTPAPGQVDPRDATYWENVSKLQFTDQNEYAKDLQEQTMADSGYNAALQSAIQGRATQQRNLGGEAIKANLASSGWLDRTQGEQTRDYTQERSNASLSKSQEDQARAAARTALIQGYGIEAAAELAHAAGRYAEGQAKEAESAAGEAAAAGGAATGSSGAAPTGKAGIGNAHAFKPVKQAIANRRRAR